MASTARPRQAVPTSPQAGWSLGQRPTRIAAVLAVVLAVIGVAAYWALNRSPESTSGEVRVGGDLHALAWMGDKLYVGGHQGAGALADGTWTQIDSLDDIDAMSFGSTGTLVFAGGHAGLFVSTDGGSSFAPASTNLPVTDIHALGADQRIVYVASPQGGTFRSTDGGKTFTQAGGAGQSFMGNIEIDPKNPDHALAPDMMAGVAETTDGGQTWHSLGGQGGAMAVAWNPKDPDDIVVIGMDGAQRTADGGKSWSDVDVPNGATAAALAPDGRLYVAALASEHASVFVQSGNSWVPVPQPSGAASTQ